MEGSSQGQLSQIRLSEARAEVAKAIQSLLVPTPESLDQCALRLQAAIRSLSASVSGLERRPGVLEEARRLQREVHQTRILLETSMEFRRQWNRRLGAMVSGYTSAGEPAVVEHGCRFWCQV